MEGQLVVLGVEELEGLIVGVAEVVTAGYLVAADRKISLLDLRHAPLMTSGLRKVVKHWQGSLPQLKDMDDSERQRIVTAFQKHFRLDGGSTEQLIEQGFEMLLIGLQALLSFVDLGGKIVKA